MSHFRTFTCAVPAATASPTPGAGAPILSAWLIVKRRSLLSLSKRRYVSLTDDHVLLIDSTPVLHLVDCKVQCTHPSRLIDLTPAPASGIPVRLIFDSPFQYSRWHMALQNAATNTLGRFYQLDMEALLGVGVHGIVRRAYSLSPFRDESLGSATTTTTTSETSTYQYHHHNQLSAFAPSQALFRRNKPQSSRRNSTDIDPDMPVSRRADCPVPTSRSDKHLLRQFSTPAPLDDDDDDGNDDGAVDLTTRPRSVAVKTISRNANGPVTVASEVLIARARLNHHAVARVIDLFETVHEVHVVMEECHGPCLSEHVLKHGAVKEHMARHIFLPILKGVGYMHACGIVHWDISPSNIMFAEADSLAEPKIIDFGTARPVNPGTGRVPEECGIFHEKGKVASLACASPELLTSKAHRYATKADMWQLGCVLYFLLMARLPFCKRNAQDLSVSATILAFCKKRSAQRENFLFGEGVVGGERVGKEAKQLLMKLLCPNARMRPNAVQCLRDFGFLKEDVREV